MRFSHPERGTGERERNFSSRRRRKIVEEEDFVLAFFKRRSILVLSAVLNHPTHGNAGTIEITLEIWNDEVKQHLSAQSHHGRVAEIEVPPDCR